ncbi:MAG: trehalose-phosphatase [Steroidobacteraceae bacterium]
MLNHMTTPWPDPVQMGRDHVCLFLDVDGTLLEFAPTPDAARADAPLQQLLAAVSQHFGGAVALVSGRTLGSLDALFAPLQLPAAGIHGFERRSADGTVHLPTLPPGVLDPVRDRLAAFARAQPGVLLEDKGSALALHFRGARGVRAEAHLVIADVAAKLDPAFAVLQGEQVLEIKPASRNKASAIEAFMKEPPFAGRRPVYIGDDVTDFDGFAAVRRNGGFDIAVGDRVSARWALADPSAVRQWLGMLLP